MVAARSQMAYTEIKGNTAQFPPDGLSTAPAAAALRIVRYCLRTNRKVWITMTYHDIKHNAEVNELLKKGNQNLGLLGFTDHSQAHCIHVAETAAHILKKFDYSAHDIELAKIAGYMHDIGNAINRTHHAEYGGLLANEILKQYDLSVADRITIVSAISNHDESTGGAVDPISAALIIGDKTDVRRSRVREKPKASFDIHDRVNYAVTDQTLKINTEAKVKSLSKGNKEKVQLVLVMCRKAQLYLLDEPIAGVDPAARDFILDTILNNYNEEGTVIISTHLIADIEKIMDEVIFIKEGNIVTYKSADDLREESGKSIDALFREIFHTDVYRGGDEVC